MPPLARDGPMLCPGSTARGVSLPTRAAGTAFRYAQPLQKPTDRWFGSFDPSAEARASLIAMPPRRRRTSGRARAGAVRTAVAAAVMSAAVAGCAARARETAPVDASADASVG